MIKDCYTDTRGIWVPPCHIYLTPEIYEKYIYSQNKKQNKSMTFSFDTT